MKLIFVFFVLLLFGCASTGGYHVEKAEFEAAQRIDTVEAYDSFLVKHPNSAWKSNVVYFRDKAAYNAALTSHDVDQLREFVRKYPNSDWAEQARYYIKYGFGK